MSYTPEQWKQLQNNGTDSYRGNVESNINELSEIVSLNENVVVSGLNLKEHNYPEFTISQGIAVKDDEKLRFNSDILLNFEDLNDYENPPGSVTAGYKIIALKFTYVQTYPSRYAEIKILNDVSELTDAHLVLKVIELIFNGGNYYIINALNYLPGEPTVFRNDIKTLIPDGGSTNQVLAKKSNDDKDVYWLSVPSGNNLYGTPEIEYLPITVENTIPDLTFFPTDPKFVKLFIAEKLKTNTEWYINGDYTVNERSIAWDEGMGGTLPVNTTVIVEYYKTNWTPDVEGIHIEYLPVTGTNQIAPLQNTPVIQQNVELYVNGVLQTNFLLDPSSGEYSINDRNIIWLPPMAGFNLEPSDEVIVQYRSLSDVGDKYTEKLSMSGLSLPDLDYEPINNNSIKLYLNGLLQLNHEWDLLNVESDYSRGGLKTLNWNSLNYNLDHSDIVLCDYFKNSTYDETSNHFIEKLPIISQNIIPVLSYIPSISLPLKLFVNGQLFKNDSLNPGYGDYYVLGDVIIWNNVNININPGDEVIAEYWKNTNIPIPQGIYTEYIVPSAPNILSTTYTPFETTKFELFINGVLYYNKEIDPTNGVYNISGKNIIWDNTAAGFDITTSDEVIVSYMSGYDNEDIYIEPLDVPYTNLLSPLTYSMLNQNSAILYVNGLLEVNDDWSPGNGAYYKTGNRSLYWLPCNVGYPLETTDVCLVKYFKSSETDIPTHTKIERLNVTGINTLDDTTLQMIQLHNTKLFVNGQLQLNDILNMGNGAYSISGKTITWNSSNAGFNLDTNDTVIIQYQFN